MINCFLYINLADLPYENEQFHNVLEILQAIHFFRSGILQYSPNTLAEIVKIDNDYGEYPSFKLKMDILLTKLHTLDLAIAIDEDSTPSSSFFIDRTYDEPAEIVDENLKHIFNLSDSNAILTLLSARDKHYFWDSPIKINQVDDNESLNIVKIFVPISNAKELIEKLIIDRLSNNLLLYEANYRKHKCKNIKGGWIKGEYISNQKSPCSCMHKYLNISVYSGEQTYFFDAANKNYIEFQHTRSNIWHGYHIDEEMEKDVPHDVQDFISKNSQLLLATLNAVWLSSFNRTCIDSICGNRNTSC